MSVRRVALEALLDITDKGAYANLRLKKAQSGLSGQDARWVAAVVYETLDHMLYIDYVLAQYVKGTQKPAIRGILRMGACELLFLRTPTAAAVNESVRLVKEIGKAPLAGFVNGALRALARNLNTPPPLPADAARRLSIQYSWPLWLVEEWLDRFGEAETEALISAPPPPMTLRPQPPYTAKELASELDRRNMPYTTGELDPNCLKLARGYDVAQDTLFEGGRIAVQSESSMLVCRACGVKPSMRVLDACAAPGGKSAYLYALCGEIDLTAWELHEHRKELLDRTLDRLHVKALTGVHDAAEPVPECQDMFDVVLIDAPCSGLGVASGKPDVRYSKSPEAIEELAQAQRRILDACAAYVRPGGVLVYASCTISCRENEEQVLSFLSRRPEFSLDDLTPYLPPALPGLKGGMMQLLPHRDHTEGFFIARMMRKA